MDKKSIGKIIVGCVLVWVLIIFGGALLTHKTKTTSAPTTPAPTPKVEEKIKTTKTDNIYASKMAIMRVTGRKVTDFWALDYGEMLSADKKVLMTKGAVELNNDGIRRLFWCSFNAEDLKLLRLKIDSQLLYSVTGK